MAKNGINDEFYTPAETIINELKWYGYDGFFKNKTIFLPCDYDATLPYIKKEINKVTKIEGQISLDGFNEVEIFKVVPELFTDEDEKNVPRNCQFVSYLTEHKKDFGIKNIYISGFDAITKEGTRFQDAPFELFDIIITNPPFSQMNEWIQKIAEFSKKGGKFLFLAPLSITTNTFAFPYFKDETFWCGYTEPSVYEDKEGNKYDKYLPSVWLTNLEVKVHKRKRPLTKSWKDHPDEFLPFWNFKAINSPSIDDIPYDYKGTIAVPATFLKDIHPDQFELVGLGQGANYLEYLDGWINQEEKGYTTDMIRTKNTGGMYSKNKTTAGVASSRIVLYTTTDLINPYKAPFCKILIKNKELVKDRKYYDYEDVLNWASNQLKNKKVEEVWNSKIFKKSSNQKVKQGKGKVN